MSAVGTDIGNGDICVFSLPSLTSIYLTKSTLIISRSTGVKGSDYLGSRVMW